MPRTTIEEVAIAAGVSRSTVSRVVNGSSAVSPRALAAVQDAIRRLDYVPNRAARSLASRQTHAIALIVPEDTTRFFGDPFFAAVVAGITASLGGSDYVLNLLIAREEQRDRAGAKVAAFIDAGGVDGALIVSHRANDGFVDRISDAVPVVFGGRPARMRPDDHIVDVDNVAAGRTATRRLLVAGRSRIATVSGPLAMPSANDRLQGFHETLADAGLTPFAVEEGDYAEASGLAAMRRILARGAPDAVFAASDLMARGVLTALHEAGLRVPDDVAVVGFDDSSVAASAHPPLTTVRQPMYEMGRTMAAVLLARLAGERPPRISLLPTELVVRASA